jgi:hypothetical protein
MIDSYTSMEAPSQEHFLPSSPQGMLSKITNQPGDPNVPKVYHVSTILDALLNSTHKKYDCLFRK